MEMGLGTALAITAIYLIGMYMGYKMKEEDDIRRRR
jgi:hypothetical protein